LSRRPELVEEELKDRSGKTHMSEINLNGSPGLRSGGYRKYSGISATA